MECLYISRYVNIEKLVYTSVGPLYFVKHPNYKFPTEQWNKKRSKGVKQSIIMFPPRSLARGRFDKKLNVYVKFNSKRATSMFIWNALNRA